MVAAPNLHTLSLRNVHPAALFVPLLKNLAIEPDELLALSSVIWDESDALDDNGYWVNEKCWRDDLIPILAQLPSVSSLSVIGPHLLLEHQAPHQLKLEHITQVSFVVNSATWLWNQPDWLLRFASLFPNLQHLHASYALHSSLPTARSFPNLQSLTLDVLDHITEINVEGHLQGTIISDKLPALLNRLVLRLPSLYSLSPSQASEIRTLWHRQSHRCFLGWIPGHSGLQTVEIHCDSSRWVYLKDNVWFGFYDESIGPEWSE